MRYRPIPSPVASEQLIGSINTTPLIDVMLVLLIMFIMIVPVTTHKVPLELPSDGDGAEATVYQLDLGANGALAWNGAAIAERQLAIRLAAVAADVHAQLNFRADGAARYEDFDRVLAEIEKAGITRLGLVDNARFVEQ